MQNELFVTCGVNTMAQWMVLLVDNRLSVMVSLSIFAGVALMVYDGQENSGKIVLSIGKCIEWFSKRYDVFSWSE